VGSARELGDVYPVVGFLLVDGMLTRDLHFAGARRPSCSALATSCARGTTTSRSTRCRSRPAGTCTPRRAWRSSTRASPSPPAAGPRSPRRCTPATSRRARSLAFQRAIAQLPRVDDRMLVLLWVLAERWGRVSRDGVRVPVGLPHRMLATLVGARRPSVTTALAGLAREGLIERTAGAGCCTATPTRCSHGAWRASMRRCRARSHGGALEAEGERTGDVRRALGDAEARLPGRPRRQRGAVEAP
jgi:hypothetical protein